MSKSRIRIPVHVFSYSLAIIPVLYFGKHLLIDHDSDLLTVGETRTHSLLGDALLVLQGSTIRTTKRATQTLKRN